MNLVLLGLVIGNTLINATPILYAGLEIGRAHV